MELYKTVHLKKGICRIKTRNIQATRKENHRYAFYSFLEYLGKEHHESKFDFVLHWEEGKEREFVTTHYFCAHL